MKNYFPMLLVCALALTALTMTSCKDEPVDDPQPQQYAISVTAGTGGLVEVKVDGAVATKASEGAQITLTVTSNEGFIFTRWVVESGDVELSDETASPVKFTMPAKNVSIRAEFAEEVSNVYDKITDPIFLFYCKEIGKFDTDGDGELSLDEARAVTKINVNEMHKLVGEPVASLAGIEYFTSLTYLTCYGNSITEIDLSNNLELTYLHIGTNRTLPKIDITKNTKLVELYVSRTLITEIDLSKCPYLEKFECNQCNELTSIDLSNNPKLTLFAAEQCPKITSLDFSNNPAINDIRCWGGVLTSIDVSKCTALTKLDCLRNKLTSLDVSNCTALKNLTCEDNMLTSLDVSKLTSLESLMCYNNRMTTLDASAMSSPNDYYLGCGLQTSDGSNSQTLKLTLRDEQKPHWQYVMADYVGVNEGVEVTGEEADIFKSITDPIFKTYCEKFDTNKDGKLTQAEAAAATEINVPKMGISSLSGLEYFSGITKLICNNNNLTSLNTSKNPKLTELVCSNNKLTELIVWTGASREVNLTTISCDNNQLTKLSVAACPKLTTLNCQKNLLIELNLNNTRSLSSLNCSDNQLASISFYDTNALTFLTCTNNKLTELNLSNKKTLMSVMCNNNLLTSLNISGCTSLMGVMAYENRLATLNASDMSNPKGYNLFCGNQTSDGATAQTLTLTLREEQKAYWNSTMKDSFMNGNIVLAN